MTIFARSLITLSAAVCLLTAAEPVKQVAGVGNFYQVNEKVYRGAQPSPEGFANLAKLGIGTVLDLREAGSRVNTEEQLVRKAGMRYVNIPLRGLSAPSPEDMVKALALLNDEKAGPVFVHCRRGADRTGTVLACYRISHDGWDNRKALQEARANGMSWMERAMQSFVLGYQAPAPATAAQVVAAQ